MRLGLFPSSVGVESPSTAREKEHGPGRERQDSLDARDLDQRGYSTVSASPRCHSNASVGKNPFQVTPWPKPSSFVPVAVKLAELKVALSVVLSIDPPADPFTGTSHPPRTHSSPP